MRFDTAQPLMSALVGGNVQIADYTALPITFNSMQRSKTSLYFLTVLYEDQKHPISYLIVPPGTPSGFQVVDLKGKRVGILPTVAYKVWFEKILYNSGIDPASVQVLPIAPSLTPTAIRSGQVDALFTNDPAATAVLKQGFGKLLSNRVEVPEVLGGKFVFGSFNITKDYADKNPDIALKVVHALDRAVEFVNAHQQTSKSIMKEFVHPSQQPYVASYPDANFKPSFSVSPKEFQVIADKYHKIGIIKKPIQVESLILSDQSFKN